MIKRLIFLMKFNKVQEVVYRQSCYVEALKRVRAFMQLFRVHTNETAETKFRFHTLHAVKNMIPVVKNLLD